MDLNKTPAIGIDLGTTHSCVGAFINGAVEIFTNDEGFKKTPSCVAFTEVQRYIGSPGLEQGLSNPLNTVFDAKVLMGRRFLDAAVQTSITRWPFSVVEMVGNPLIKVVFQGQEMLFTAEEITSMVISKVKEIAETFLGGLVHDAVITVPAHFSDSQRQATKDAGTIAGLRVLKVLNDTTAAALAYGLGQNLTEEKTILIFDLGGGTLSVAVVSIKHGSLFEVLSTAGNTNFGGKDFNYRILDYFMSECVRRSGVNISDHPRAFSRLMAACERAKQTLTHTKEAAIEIEALVENTDFQMTITRARFEAICEDLFESILEPVKLALSDAKLEKNEIHEVILVGGSTRIPRIQKILKEFFGWRELNKSINPDEVVAYGAALQAAIITGDIAHVVKDVLVVDITTLSLGIETPGGAMNIILPRGTIIPALAPRVFTTNVDDQTSVTIQMFQGERPVARDNYMLGHFVLSGIAPAPKGAPQVPVTFRVDENGIVSVSAQGTGSSTESITVVTDKGRLTGEDISRMILEIEVYKVAEQKKRECLLLLHKLETYIYEVKRILEIHDDQVTVENRTLTKKACEEVLIWLESNRDAHKAEIQQRLQTLKTICGPIISHLIGSRSVEP